MALKNCSQYFNCSQYSNWSQYSIPASVTQICIFFKLDHTTAPFLQGLPLLHKLLHRCMKLNQGIDSLPGSQSAAVFEVSRERNGFCALAPPVITAHWLYPAVSEMNSGRGKFCSRSLARTILVYTCVAPVSSSSISCCDSSSVILSFRTAGYFRFLHFEICYNSNNPLSNYLCPKVCCFLHSISLTEAPVSFCLRGPNSHWKMYYSMSEKKWIKSVWKYW